MTKGASTADESVAMGAYTADEALCEESFPLREEAFSCSFAQRTPSATGTAAGPPASRSCAPRSSATLEEPGRVLDGTLDLHGTSQKERQ